jgi:hypothetical protein
LVVNADKTEAWIWETERLSMHAFFKQILPGNLWWTSKGKVLGNCWSVAFLLYIITASFTTKK